MIFITNLGSYLMISARNLDPKRGGPRCLQHSQGTGSAIPGSFIQVSQGFIQSFCPPLQGLGVCLQGSLKNTVITFNEACPCRIIRQVESPFDVIFFCPGQCGVHVSAARDDQNRLTSSFLFLQ